MGALKLVWRWQVCGLPVDVSLMIRLVHTSSDVLEA